MCNTVSNINPGFQGFILLTILLNMMHIKIYEAITKGFSRLPYLLAVLLLHLELHLVLQMVLLQLLLLRVRRRPRGVAAALALLALALGLGLGLGLAAGKLRRRL